MNQYPYSPDNEPVSRFELAALAFADLIQSEIEGSSSFKVSPQVEPFEKVRCVCGKNEAYGKLIQCSSCHCYLHKDCIEFNSKKASPYQCPFCRLQIDGIDPFMELKKWIEMKDSEIKSLRVLIEDYVSSETHPTFFGYPNPNEFGHSKNPGMNMRPPYKKAHDIIEKLLSFMNS